MKKQLTHEYLWNSHKQEYDIGYKAGYEQALKDMAEKWGMK